MILVPTIAGTSNRVANDLEARKECQSTCDCKNTLQSIYPTSLLQYFPQNHTFQVLTFDNKKLPGSNIIFSSNYILLPVSSYSVYQTAYTYTPYLLLAKSPYEDLVPLKGALM
jgi:hypothetical protein